MVELFLWIVKSQIKMIGIEDARKYLSKVLKSGRNEVAPQVGKHGAL